jgi:hypothetical protein
MPQLPTNPVDIVLEIPDVKIEGTTIKRKAVLFALIYNMNTKQVSISWTVTHYAPNGNGTYGANLSDIIPSYSKEQIATNDVPVNPITGHPIDPASIDDTTDYIGQYDFFNNMGENQPVKVHDIIKEFGLGLQNWNK